MERSVLVPAGALLVGLLLVACGGGATRSPAPAEEEDNRQPPPPPPALVQGDVFLLVEDGRLVTLDRQSPAVLKGQLSITGLPDGERLLGMDFRPATGDLYVLGDSATLFVVDHSSAEVTASIALQPAAGSLFAGLEGDNFGVGFNPVPDRLRVTSDSGQNLRINVDSGETLVDGALDSGEMTTMVTASGYTNSFAGTATTRLFNIDSGDSLLYQQLPPNDGNLVNPRPLGLEVDLASGFAIDGTDNSAFATLRVDGVDGFYQIDLNAAAEQAVATELASLASVAGKVVGLALLPPAPPQLLALTNLNQLAAFSLASPGELQLTEISGLAMTDEPLIGLDVRPATGELYALSAFANIYIINPDSGEASLQATLTPAEGDSFAGLDGSDFAMDFNPVPDRLRLISDRGQNLRINVDTGATITDGDIALASQEQGGLLEGTLSALVELLLGEGEEGVTTVTAAAYTNSFAGTASTMLFTLDVANDTLNLQTPPNDGTQVPVAEAPLALLGDQAFDIAGGDNGLALAALVDTENGAAVLYRVNLSSGDFALLAEDVAASTIGGEQGPALKGLTIVLQ